MICKCRITEWLRYPARLWRHLQFLIHIYFLLSFLLYRKSCNSLVFRTLCQMVLLIFFPPTKQFPIIRRKWPQKHYFIRSSDILVFFVWSESYWTSIHLKYGGILGPLITITNQAFRGSAELRKKKKKNSANIRISWRPSYSEWICLRQCDLHRNPVNDCCVLCAQPVICKKGVPENSLTRIHFFQLHSHHLGH